MRARQKETVGLSNSPGKANVRLSSLYISTVFDELTEGRMRKSGRGKFWSLLFKFKGDTRVVRVIYVTE
jgi:hypothetical protein